MLLSQFPLTFHRIHAPFHHITYEYSSADWDDLRHHLRDVPWEDIFKLGASVPASKFCEWVQVGIDIHICHRKYLVKPHSTPWFSTAGAAAIVHRNLCLKIYLFCLYQKDKSSDSKEEFRLASNCCYNLLRLFLKQLQLHILIKQKSLLLPRTLALLTLGKLLIVFSTKVNLLYLLYSTA